MISSTSQPQIRIPSVDPIEYYYPPLVKPINANQFHLPSISEKMKRICVISDTHNYHNRVQLEPCNILICCGDYSNKGYKKDITKFAQWLSHQPAQHILLIPGNHDFDFIQKYPKSKRWITDYCSNVTILQNEACMLFGITFYGYFNRTKQFDENEIKMLYQTIPDTCDILITHRPPFGILDDKIVFVDKKPTVDGNYGVDPFEQIVYDKNVKLHCFGHIHSCNGFIKKNDVLFINASLSEEFVRDIVDNKPFYLNIDCETKEITIENEEERIWNGHNFNRQYYELTGRNPEE